MNDTVPAQEGGVGEGADSGSFGPIAEDGVHPHIERATVEQRIRASLTPEHGVAWVRVSDLISTGTGRIAGRGIDLESEFVRRLRHLVPSGRTDVRRRALLPPLDAFGRRTTTTGRAALGRR